MNDFVGDPAGVPQDAVLTDPAEFGAPMGRHLPVRPAWTCAVEGKPWPCPSARVHLRTRYVNDRPALAIFMSTQLMTAAVDITHSDSLPPDLFNRFMGWT